MEDEMSICKEIGITELGKHAALLYSWDINGVMVEPIDKEDSAMINKRSKAKDDGTWSKEGCDWGSADEDFPLLPLNKFINSYKLLPFLVSTVTGTGDILSSSSYEWVKSILEVGMDETWTFIFLNGFSSI